MRGWGSEAMIGNSTSLECVLLALVENILNDDVGPAECQNLHKNAESHAHVHRQIENLPARMDLPTGSLIGVQGHQSRCLRSLLCGLAS